VRKLAWTLDAWSDYSDLQASDKQLAAKINKLIKDIMRSPFEGLGKPAPLKHNLSGCWSRRITLEHRLTYQVLDDEIVVLACKGHY